MRGDDVGEIRKWLRRWFSGRQRDAELAEEIREHLEEKIVLSGLAVGLAGSFAAVRLIRSSLYGITATDPVTFAAVPILLLAVALLASYLPARRAMQVDPVAALRHE